MSADPLQAIVEVVAVLRAEADHLRELAAIDPGDPLYALAAEQVEAVAAVLESRAVPAATSRSASPEDKSGIPSPPDPG